LKAANYTQGPTSQKKWLSDSAVGDVAVNSDNTLLAKVSEPRKVEVYSFDFTLLATFVPPNS
jgi:hypothetical protein